MRRSCLLVTSKKHRLFPDLMNVCRAHFCDVAAIHYEPTSEWPDDGIARANEMMRGREILISIYNEKLFKGDQLQCVNFNIHPAPPAYPGRGSASLALFDGVRSFGPVAHVMEEIADAGPIFGANPIPVFDWDSCETLFNRSERAGVELLTTTLQYYVLEGTLPKPNGLKWDRRPMTKKQFDQWMICDPMKPDELTRKVRAVRHSVYKGPYVIRSGQKLGLVDDRYIGNAVSIGGYRFSPEAV